MEKGDSTVIDITYNWVAILFGDKCVKRIRHLRIKSYKNPPTMWSPSNYKILVVIKSFLVHIFRVMS